MDERAPGRGPGQDSGSGPELGCAGRALALCAAGVVLAAFSAGAALLAWNLAAAASRRAPCPEPPPGPNATAPPTPDRGPDLQDLRRRLEELERRGARLRGRLDKAEEAHGACQARQNLLQTQLLALETEMKEAKAQGTQMGAENGALTEALERWEAEATESARRLEDAQQRARVAEAEGEACAAREAELRERVSALGAPRTAPRPRPRSGSRAGHAARHAGGCRRPARARS
ncbi:coiled-coil domain-containing protein 194 [Erinaceus europaeus]|uniref:Coiled-coil domain-containing protein 194 n=1 Tax=Erinaceus europaeus TaxID=9365 RepID=A0ABM3WP98_ERIEU|nr:coiled-coil domain-containing protein 194 [Erinaceus europaeus]